MKHIGRKIAVPAVGIVLAGGSFAFLASNSVADSHAGEGTGNIAGYQVSDISYTYDTQTQGDPTTPNNGQMINSVSFTLDSAATEVSAIVHGDYYYHYNACGSSNGGLRWTCTTGRSDNLNQAPVGLANTVTVTAVN